MQEPKDLFEELIDKISDGFVALDKDWHYTYVNDKGASFLNGHTPRQLIGKHIWTVFPEGIGQPFHKNYEKVMNERVSITMIEYYEPWDKYFENRISPTNDGGISILFTDVTDQKRSERQIKESEMYMKMILENTEEFFVIIDKNYTIVTSNRSVRNFGSNVLESSFQVGTNAINLSQESERLQMKALYDNVLSGNHRKIKFKAIVKDGVPFILELKLTPIIDDLGNCEQFIVNTRDVTKEELALEEIIKTSEERKSAENLAISAFKEKQKILDSSLDVICSSDSESRFLQVSIASKSLWGYEPEELVGKKYFDLVYDEDYEATLKVSNSIKSGLDTVNFENRFVKKDGSLIPLVWSARWDDNDKIMYSVARDATEKQKAIHALQNSEKKYKSLFNLSPLPKWIYEISTFKFLEVNNAAVKHYGYGLNEFLSKTILDIRPEEDKNEFIRQFKSISHEGSINFGTWRHIKANGEIIHVEISGHKVDYNGIDAMMILSNDVTESIKSQELIDISQKALLKSNERYQFVTQATSDTIWDWDIKSQQLYWADTYTTLFGHKVENNRGDLSTWYNNIHPDEREAVVQNLDEFVVGEETVWQNEYKYQKADGSYALIADKGIAIRDEKGVPYRMIGAMRDITKEKEQYYEIKRIQQNLNTLINNTTDYIWSIDKDMKVLAYNNSFSRLMFLLTGQTIKEGIYALIPELKKELRDNWKIFYERALKGERFSVEDHDTLPDNSKTYGIVSFTPISALDGTVQGVACFGKDISDLKRSEERLLELNKELEKRAEELVSSNIELERFAYVASHDLQEPLRMVSSFLQLLEKKYEGTLDETAQKYIHFAVDGAARMKILIKDLLQYSKIGIGALELVSIDMNQVLTDIQFLFKEEIYNSQGEVIIQDLPIIQAGKTAMMQLFQNLVGNALKYKSPDIAPKIEISYTEDNQYWKFQVKDNGLGIDPDYNDKIFVIFQRLHNKDEYSGTGIGLAICKKIVERYQGQIWVESELGAGSTFIFTIAKNPII